MAKRRWLVAMVSLLSSLVVFTSAGIGSTWALFTDVESSSDTTLTAWTPALWAQTTQEDFEHGVPYRVDTSVSPGDVCLATLPDSVTDTLDNEDLIAAGANLIVSGGQVMLIQSSRTEQLRPDGVGASTHLTPSPGPPNYSRVNEAVSDGDTSWVQNSTTETYLRDTYTLQDPVVTPSTVQSVTVCINAASRDKSQPNGRTVLRTNGSDYVGATCKLDEVYTVYSTTYATNPSTGTAWTADDIHHLEAGVDLQSRSTGQTWRYARCTQVWVEVTYSAYDSPGTLVSVNLLTGCDVARIDSFSCSASEIPVSAGLKVQFSQDNADWYSSTGDLNGWDTLSQGTDEIDLSALGWSGPDFYYRAEFSTDGSATPVLDEVAANYSYCYLSGTLACRVLDTGIADSAWDALCWNETLAAGTDIAFEVRASNASFGEGDAMPAWMAVGGAWPVMTGLPAGRFKQWRAALTTVEASQTPVLHEVRVHYTP